MPAEPTWPDGNYPNSIPFTKADAKQLKTAGAFQVGGEIMLATGARAIPERKSKIALVVREVSLSGIALRPPN